MMDLLFHAGIVIQSYMYNAHQFIVEDSSVRNARICLVKAIQQVLKNGLSLIGVSSPEKM